MTTVLVTDAERGSSVAVIRSLGRRGHNVVAAACRRLVPGFYSRYTTTVVRYPDATHDPAAAIEAVIEAAHRHRVDLIVPVCDEILLPLSYERHRLPPTCAIAVPEPSALEVVVDKLATLELARSVAVPVPDTEAVDSGDEAVAVASRLGWPLVVKPRRSYEWRAGGRPARRYVSYALDDEGLRRAVADAGDEGVLLQRRHDGVGRAVSLLAHEGRPLAAFQHRRLREVPFTGGASSLRISETLDTELYDMAARLLCELRWTGLAMVEFKSGPQGAVLMEINGRVWGALALAVASGMDFPARLAELYLSGPPAEGIVDAHYAVGVRSRDLELEQRWISDALLRRHVPFGEVPRRRDAAAVAVRLLWPGDGYDILDWRDARPGIVEVAKLASKPVREGVQRLRHRAGR